MIVFDTNLLSELMRLDPSPRVMDWIMSRDPAEFFTTAITQIEILAGLAVMPSGKRKAGLEAAADSMFSKDFSGHVLAFDDRAARVYADLIGERTPKGLPTPAFDMMIAAIARVHGAVVATRDVKDFADCQVEILNPWEDAILI